MAKKIERIPVSRLDLPKCFGHVKRRYDPKDKCYACAVFESCVAEKEG